MRRRVTVCFAELGKRWIGSAKLSYFARGVVQHLAAPYGTIDVPLVRAACILAARSVYGRRAELSFQVAPWGEDGCRENGLETLFAERHRTLGAANATVNGRPVIVSVTLGWRDATRYQVRPRAA